MKLKKLTIHNIASIEDAVIDFEHGPLAEDSRFLICGPTGSGKTTLLDCICLALFTKTPRLYEVKKEGFVDKNEKYELPSGVTDVKIGDTRMLMRRGSSHAFVELVFTDKDDKILKSSWICNRGKRNGALKTPEWRLADEDDTVITCKKTELEPIISERIGLTFDQFCRTTMLAQGEFTRFLKSEEGQKSEILEKLTGTDIYSEISKKIHEITNEKNKVCELIKSKLDGVTLLTEENRNEKLQEQKELRTKAEQLNAEENKLTAIISWMEQLQNMERQYEKICKDYEEQHKLMETDEFVRENRLVDDWQRTAQLRINWNVRADAAKLIAQHRETEAYLKSRYVKLCAGLLSLKNDEKRDVERKGSIETFIEAESPKAESYSQIDLIQTLAQQHRQLSLQITKARANVENKNKESAGLVIAREAQLARVGKCTADAEAKSKELDVWSQKLQKMNYSGLLSQQKEQINALNALKEYQTLLEKTTRSNETLLQKEKELNDIRKDIVVYEEDTEKAEIAEKELDDQLAQQQKIYDKQVLACNDIIKEYRSVLSVGDVCPMCGQKINAITSDEHFESVLQPVKECLEELQKKHNDARKQLSDKKAALSQAKNTEMIRRRECSAAEAQDKEASAELQSHAMYAEYGQHENTTDEINKKKDHIDVILRQIDEQLKTVGELQREVSALQKDKDYAEKLLHDEEVHLKEMDNKYALTQNIISTEKKNIESLNSSVSDIEVNMSQYISLEKYKSDGEQYISDIKTAAEKYQKAKDMLQNIEKNLQKIVSELEYIGGLKSKIEEKHEDWKNVEVIVPVSIAGMSSQWVQLQADVMENAEAVRQTEKKYSDADAVIRDYLKEENAVTETELSSLAMLSDTDVRAVSRKLQNLRDSEIRMKAEMNTVEGNIKKHKALRPEFEEGLTHETAVINQQNKKSEISELNQLLGQIAQTLQNDEDNKKHFAEITRKLEEANKEYIQWSRLNELFGSHDGKKFRNIAQSYVLEQLLINANQYLLQFTDRYEMVCQPGSFTILLRDNEAGGVMRPTSTISGGESFLISLSLALGLSSLSRASFSVDTLFIDEGFGTLDSTYLSCVMDALERLHQMGGKRIGIISHVESLKERITTQIQISRVNNTSSKVEVVSTI